MNKFIKYTWKMVMFFVLLGFLIGSLFALYSETNQKTQWKQMSEVSLTPPLHRPVPGQDSIDRAIAMFGIEVPESANYPYYDNNIEDRGRTIRNTRSSKATVQIGNSAFDSWAILGSTLAHELEVHCRQSFLMIQLLDLVGLKGTHIAEQQAYNYEIKNAKRFGLRDFEISNINDTKYYFYTSHMPKLEISNKFNVFAEKILFKN